MGVLKNTLDEGNKQYPSGNSKFIKLEDGDNRIRIVSPMQVFGRHFVQGEGYKTCIGGDKGCEYCRSQEDEVKKVTPAYFCWAIDRKDKLIKEAKLSYTILKSIDDLTATEEYNFVPTVDGVFPYDINIRVISGTKKGEKVTYNILPLIIKELTGEEKEAVGKLKPPMIVVEEMKGIKTVKSDEVNVDNIPF